VRSQRLSDCGSGLDGGSWQIWIDRGGTFTDLVARDPHGRLHVRKVLSEQPGGGGDDPSVEAIRTLLGVATGAVLPADAIRELRLGTTVATNALLEHRGAGTDRRIELTSEGRGALPTALVIEQIDRCQWISHGDAAAIRRTEGRDKAERDLNNRQGLVLDEVRDQWEQKLYEMDAIYLRAALPPEFSGKDPQRQASATLEQLARKELLEKRKVPVPGLGFPESP